MELSNSLVDDSVRVFLLIENRLLGETLDRLFHKRPDFCLVGRCSAADTGTIDVRNLQCDVVVLDHQRLASLLDGLSDHGEQAAARPRTVLISMEENEEQFFTAVRSGISAYLLKDASADDVVAAVHAATRGEAVCPPRLCFALFQCMARIALETPVQNWERPKAVLTIRQQQLIALVAKGLTNKEIASQLNLSEYTIRNHIHRIMKQVDVGSRGEAVQAIRAHGYSITA
jgi:two-component system, NarL family, nitrate/nitrite response regulator NarL